jgi:glycosyltransferase involved in cell wall biosynthesis
MVFKYLLQHRVAFCERLRDQLDARGVELRLIYGQPGPEDAPRQDEADLAWANRIRNVVVPLGRRELFWQPALPLLREADLVVVNDASKLLLNYVLMLQQVVGRRRVALLGHGFNARRRPGTRLGERLKRVVSQQAHWWFAYNEASANAVARLGYPRERITSIQNAIDTRSLVAARQAVAVAQLHQLRQELGVRGGKIGLFIGGMYEDKLLPFLLEACGAIRRAVPDFEMMFMGAGHDEGLVRAAAAEHPWIHHVKPKFEAEKVPYCMLADVLLLPAAVGLTVLDSFALQLPLVTIAEQYHGPEIAYLEHEVNGVVLPRSTGPAAYAAEVVRLLQDESRMARLRAGCCHSSTVYTAEEMARRFADGLLQALAA